jgi:secondary thiamine-phosphate synthase enzyme
VDSTEISVHTGSRRVTDLSAPVARFCAGRGDGLCHVFAPHATAGLAIIETGSGSEDDLSRALDRLLPRDDRYGHRHGSTGHGADHLLPAFVAPFLVLAVRGGRLQLGTWQSVVLVDTNADNPERRVQLSFLGE